MLLSGLDVNKIWEIIINYRATYFIENIDAIGSEICFVANEYILEEDDGMESKINYIEKELEKLGSASSNYTIGNNSIYDFTDTECKTAGEMFIYLNLCPKFMFEWTQLYVDLFSKASPSIIVQTLNRVMITSKLMRDETTLDIARKIFITVNKILSLNFETISTLSEGNLNINRNTIKSRAMQKSNNLNTIKKVSNHPVHIYDIDGKLSPSAFIPFCAFGQNMSALGVLSELYELPICDSFKAKVKIDQLCYEVDLEGKGYSKMDLKSGLVFFLDYNEDRQLNLWDTLNGDQHGNFLNKVDESHDDEKSYIYLDTIGETMYIKHHIL